MILWVASVMTLLGFAGLVAGVVLDMEGLAIVGAMIVVGIGAGVTSDGLTYRDGRVEQAAGNTGETVVEPTYTSLDTSEHLPLGLLWMLLGSAPMFYIIPKLGT